MKLVPPYKVTAHFDEKGQIIYTPQFKQGNYVAFKRWHHRAMEARAKLLKELSNSQQS